MTSFMQILFVYFLQSVHPLLSNFTFMACNLSTHLPGKSKRIIVFYFSWIFHNKMDVSFQWNKLDPSKIKNVNEDQPICSRLIKIRPICIQNFVGTWKIMEMSYIPIQTWPNVTYEAYDKSASNAYWSKWCNLRHLM